MSLLSIIGLINFFTSISLGLFVLTRNSKNPLNVSYFAFNCSIAIYSFGYFAWQYTQNVELAIIWFYVMMFGTIFINQMYLPFIFTLTDRINERRTFLIFYSIANIIFLLLLFTTNMFDNFAPRHGWGYWPIPKLSLTIYMIFWFWSCFYGFWCLIKEIRHSPKFKKQQLKIVAIALMLGFNGGASNWPVWYGYWFPPYPSIMISIYVALIAYAIVRHKLMDFNLIFRWGLAVSILILVLFLMISPLVLILEFISRHYFKFNPGFSVLISTCILVVVFDPLRKKVTKFVDQIIFKSPDFEDILSKIRAIKISAKNSNELGDKLSKIMKSIWGVEHAGLALWNFQDSNFRFYPEINFSNKTISSIKKNIDKSDFLVRTLESERRLFKFGVVVDDDISTLINRASSGEKTTFMKIQRTLRWLGASACVPLSNSRELIGFIILGSKKNKGIYNDEDKKFLSHVSPIVSSIISQQILSPEIS